MNGNTNLALHTTTEMVPVNHKKLEIIPFEALQSQYRDNVNKILTLEDEDAIETEKKLAKIFGIAQEKINSILKIENPGWQIA